MTECVLRRRVRDIGIVCDEDNCLFWAHLGPEGEDTTPQCAVQYFKLLDGEGPALAEWLLGLKDSEIVEALGMRRIEPAR